MVGLPTFRKAWVRFAVVLTLAALGTGCATKTADAAVACGETDPATNVPARAVLTLDDKSAVTNLALKRSTKKKALSLVFSVSGCDLADASTPPTLLVVPTRGGDELPDEVLSVKRAEVDGPMFFLRLEVDPKKMDPGTYNSIVIARAPYLASNRTPVTLSRSEDAAWKVLGVAALAAIAGLVWLLALKVVDTSAVTRTRLIILCALAVAAGVYAGANNYYSQDVWAFGENLKSLATAAFLGATTGSVAAVLASRK